MTRESAPLNPPTLPRPVGYSHAWQTGGGRLLFVSGQVAKDASGAVVGRGDLVAQFRQVCENWRVLLTAAGGTLADVVKLTIYVLDVDAYRREARALGAVWRDYFGRHYPAMTLVGCRDLWDAPEGCLIEIDGMAVLD